MLSTYMGEIALLTSSFYVLKLQLEDQAIDTNVNNNKKDVRKSNNAAF